MTQVIVLDYRRPRIKLLGWLLEDSGIGVDEVCSVDAAVELAHAPDCRCLIVNSAESQGEVARIMGRIRASHPHCRLAFIAIDHACKEPLPESDVCLHAPLDADDLVDEVRRIVDDAA